MTKKNASSTLYFIFFFIIFLAFCAFAVDGVIVLTNRAKLQNITEMTAMAAASEFNSDYDNPKASPATAKDVSQVDKTAQDTFRLLKNDSLQTATMDIPVNIDPGGLTVTITTHMVAQPFFLSFLGVTGINLDAHAKAKSETLPVYATYEGVNWLTAKANYTTDIVPNDSAILPPLGSGYKSASYDYTKTPNQPNYSLINLGENSLSLGPGGFITIKLPVPIVDKEGYDLEIKENNNNAPLEGYMVFAGIDKDPSKPYVDYTNTGGGLLWVNISCTGVPEIPLGYPAIYTTSTNYGAQDKFYGSGYFDIGNSCAGGISMAKYIRIVDDNSESAFIQSGGTYYKTMLYGESSSATAGADIDSVTVLNHVMLQ